MAKSGPSDVLNLVLASIGLNPTDLNPRQLRLCELLSLSLEQLEGSVGRISDRVVIQVLKGGSLHEVHTATLAVVEAARLFLSGAAHEGELQRALGNYEAAWRSALLLAKTQIQDEQAIRASTKN